MAIGNGEHWHSRSGWPSKNGLAAALNKVASGQQTADVNNFECGALTASNNGKRPLMMLVEYMLGESGL